MEASHVRWSLKLEDTPRPTDCSCWTCFQAALQKIGLVVLRHQDEALHLILLKQILLQRDTGVNSPGHLPIFQWAMRAMPMSYRTSEESTILDWLLNTVVSLRTIVSSLPGPPALTCRWSLYPCNTCESRAGLTPIDRLKLSENTVVVPATNPADGVGKVMVVQLDQLVILCVCFLNGGLSCLS